MGPAHVGVDANVGAMRFDWWHPEYTAKCFIIVTMIEIHRLILDVFGCYNSSC